MACLARAFVHLVTDEGRSPYVHADVLSELARRGVDAKLTRLAPDGTMTLVVDGARVRVVPRRGGWLCTRADGSGICFDPERTVLAPRVMRTVRGREVDIERLLVHWPSQWPTRKAAASVDGFEAYASTLARKKIRVPQLAPLAYASEAAIADAVLAARGLSPKSS